MKKIYVILLIMGVFALAGGCSDTHEAVAFNYKSLSAARDLSIQVVYDNNSYDPELKTAWGFSCYIKGTDKKILFDTGGDSQILLSNMEILGIEPDDVDIVVLSHIHGDHTGGLAGFLGTNPDVAVYLPASFAGKYKRQVEEYAAVIEVLEPLNIGKNCFSTGEMGDIIREQALAVKTEKGFVLITGCAHPGIADMVSKAKKLSESNVLLVMGGFHLGGYSEGGIMDIISEFKEMGVEYAGPCHCSGGLARNLFEKEYGNKYIEIGVGKKISISNL